MGRLGFGKTVAGVPSAEASRAVEDEVIIGEDDFGGAGGADNGTAMVTTWGLGRMWPRRMR